MVGASIQKGFFNHEPHEKAWGGLPPTTYFLQFFHPTSCCVKILARNYAVAGSYVAPLQGFAEWVGIRTQGVALGWYIAPLQG
jgi:hypothetical protein